MDKLEALWDKKLNIQTCGNDDSKADAYRYPYEPTPYCVLERLADSGFLDEKSHLLDYGCGKGRVGLYLHHVLGCKADGVDYDPRMIAWAEENLRTNGKQGVNFHCCSAEDFTVTEQDSFYFFNPFSVEILRAALDNIMESYYENPRAMRLFFYYPSDEYLGELMCHDALMFVDEIDCQDLFPGKNQRERILVFEMC